MPNIVDFDIMEREIVPTNRIPFRTILALIETVDLLRANLENLDRVLWGAISADAKRNIGRLVNRFADSVKNVICDDMLDLAIRNMILISETIKNTGSYDGDGYISIEKNVAHLFYQIGFIKGIFLDLCYF